MEKYWDAGEEVFVPFVKWETCFLLLEMMIFIIRLLAVSTVFIFLFAMCLYLSSLYICNP